jgi:hypothetical protein
MSRQGDQETISEREYKKNSVPFTLNRKKFNPECYVGTVSVVDPKLFMLSQDKRFG